MVKHHLDRIASDIMFLQETKCNEEAGETFVKFCKGWKGVFQEVDGSVGGLGIIWKPNLVEVTPIRKRRNWMACRVQIRFSSLDFVLWNVYGPTPTIDEAKVWDELSQGICSYKNEKFIFVGDFNAILDLSEKSEGRGRWEMNNIPLSTSTLPIGVLDHFLIQLEFSSKCCWGNGYFKFQNMWWREKSLLKSLELWNECSFNDTISYCFVKKITYIEDKLRIWNREVFKTIFEGKEAVENALAKLNERVVSYGMNQADYLREKDLKAKLFEVLAIEEIY
ncbi:uncharacterized protein LOC131063048 [Cryptomeria japonica]|uniref:uncharacterized protein LOC131063048 n=1 Tax=Cryptomeria japonica TaxID=3369 RepID=UPI0025AC4628|nr:uncharacterized protein LOC131063048 [Cryptomeria japonica]